MRIGASVSEMAGAGTAELSRIARTAKAREDLPANGIVPIAERRTRDVGARRPRPTAQHLVLVAEEDLRVLGIWKCFEARIADEVARRPLPHVADHAVA